MLTPKQRRFLRALAHPLSPVVRVGRGKVTPSLVEEIRNSLAAHELIKLRIDADDSAKRRTIAEDLARAAEAELAGTIGKVAILYRAREEKPKIELPK